MNKGGSKFKRAQGGVTVTATFTTRLNLAQLGCLSHRNELGVSNECKGWGDRMVISDKTDVGDIKDKAAKWLK